MGEVIISRVYDAEPAEGAVFLVDGMWPRGVRKDGLTLDGWARDVAPSPELRRWFGHRPERFAEFRTRYRRELDRNPDAVRPLLDAARAGTVTLLYAAKDTEHNNAVVLREYLRDYLRDRLTTPA
ncbi:uncharacterized protein YeaO (DUF488 family) [Streptosporangium becharense]|uniref:Uncharacterized protein YeaO (DUF488 family) n=1 Tax=Streptosporangium becharense TaxID=1816182 RepID=A0A7W9MI84_9ACTN|nr:DUF488 family protein [Streptosporangium becharense]MBB2911232.1 uncharacterized protein YeaO (DUF488 family) [Streptosporangium becharense]MBB5821710.1 uncharacterized protein YeaO (DUF488 family) [Streptosporangium becharense]